MTDRPALLVTSDLHLSDNDRDAYRHAWMERFIALVQKRKPGLVLILGDITERKENHSAWLVNTIVGYLHRLSEVCPVIGLQGNHDYKANPDDGFWPFLSHIPNVTWISKPTGLPFAGYNLLFLPHTRDYQRDWGPFNIRDAVKLDWIFCHNTFEGAVGGFGHKLSGIPLSVFPPDARVISGDIHAAQTIGPVTYVGAPFLTDFGDDYEPRILLLEGHNRKSIKCPGPQKRLITISDVAELTLQHHVKAGDIIKVQVNLPMSQREHWPAIKTKVLEWAGQLGCDYITVKPQYQTGDRVKLKASGRRSDEDTLKAYAKARGVSPGMVKVGLELLDD